MENKITLEQYRAICKDIVSDKNGITNKKCHFCNCQIIIKYYGSSYDLKCEKECFTLGFRGI